MTEIELMVYDQKGSSPKVMPGVQTHNRQVLKAEAEFAKAMIQIGMCAGRHDKHGDNEKMRLLPVTEVVNRACALAELAYAEFDKRGWIIPLPSRKEMLAEINERTEASGSVGFLAREQAGRNGKAHP